MKKNEITKKEIVSILKEQHLMIKAYAVDNYIRNLYCNSSAKQYMQEFKNGFISFVQNNVENDTNCHTREAKVNKIREIISINYPYTKRKT